MKYHAVIAGGGIIGCAVARALAAKQPGWKILLLEKEKDVAQHTSGRNSGVIHSGFNAKPGSLKAQFCVEGSRRLRQFCRERNIPTLDVGTLVVANEESEEPTLVELERRGRANGVPGIGMIDAKRLKEIEPNATGRCALHSPSGSVVDGKTVVEAYAADAKAAGVEFVFERRVTAIDPFDGGFHIRAGAEKYETAHFVNCAGLHADRVAHLLGVAADLTIFPFRGDYYKLVDSKSDIVRSMIYPAPNIKYPFLGIHFTKKVTGHVLAGPNAVLAMGRESYQWTDVHVPDTLGMFASVPFWRMVARREFLSLAAEQLRTTISKRAFLARARRLVPGLEMKDLIPARSGNRAQLVNRRGDLVEDLVVERAGRAVHVLNAVSPGLTCSLPFADYVVGEILK